MTHNTYLTGIKVQPPAPAPIYKVQSISMVARASEIVDTRAPKPVIRATPKVFYGPGILEMIQYVVDKCPKEVGWWGLVETLGNDYIITKLYFPEQTVSGAETDITPDAMADLMMEIMNANDDPSQLYYWGHSHVRMAVNPSGQDETQVSEYLENCPIFIRGIYNKMGNAKVDVYDVEQKKVYECVENMRYNFGLEDEITDHLDELIKTNVKERVYTQPAKTYGGYQGGRGYQGDIYDTETKNLVSLGRDLRDIDIPPKPRVRHFFVINTTYQELQKTFSELRLAGMEKMLGVDMPYTDDEIQEIALASLEAGDEVTDEDIMAFGNFKLQDNLP